MTEEQIIKLDAILANLRATCIADDSLPVLAINQWTEDPNDISAFTASDCTKEVAARILIMALRRLGKEL